MSNQFNSQPNQKTEFDQDRVERERVFHNDWASSVKINELMVEPAFESPTALENQYILQEIGDFKSKKILDLGCGAGESSVYFAVRGAEVHACDISENLLQLAGQLAKSRGVAIQTYVCPAENLPFADNTFDLVYGNGVLHHVNLDPSMKEVARVMKPGAKGYFIEPLPYNPIINIYRWVARDVRTVDEKPLHFSQINSLRKSFSDLTHREFWLFSLYIFMHFFLVRRWHPSKVRYWKKVIEVGPEFSSMIGTLKKWDHRMMRIFPFLGFLCWNTVIKVTK